MKLTDFSFYRFQGEQGFVGDIELDQRAVYGVSPDLAYAILPEKTAPILLKDGQAQTLEKESRVFKADPTRMFSHVDFNAAPTKAPAAPAPKIVKPRKVKKDSDLGEHIPDPKPARKMEVEKTFEDISEMRAKENREEFWGWKARPISYAETITTGGSAGNYMVKKLDPFGGVHLPVVPISEMKMGTLPRGENLFDFPTYVFEDIRDNVLAAVGLKVALPFDRLAVGATDKSTRIDVTTRAAVRYGFISINPAQIVSILGGFNSKTVAQAITHELAHFIDFTMIKNSERMRFEQSLRGKEYHPQQKSTGASAPIEQFATLAELMVWGDSARRVFYLNGFEIVNKYFENRYVSEIDLKTRII